MKSLKLLAIGGSMALLGACTNLQTLQSTPPGAGGTEFTRALAQQYRTYAASKWNARGDFWTSEWFAAKALRVNAGEALPPEELGTWGPWAEVANELAEARARLVRALDGNARTRFPADAAIAQRAFDCWLANASTVTAGGTPWSPYAPSGYFRQMTGQAAEPVQTHLKSCKDEFFEALARIEGPAPVAGDFTIYFATGRWEIDARGQATIREAVAAIRARRATNVVVQGYADTVGRPGPNQILSERRANEVRRVLLAEGVQANISTQGFGETQLAVPTPDNTPEQRNRRAVIILR
jgi:OOP family OmpA-OmpF porin